MRPSVARFAVLNTVADFTQHYGFAPPSHPLLTVIDLAQYPIPELFAEPALRHLYLVVLKRHFHGQLPYGQQVYDYRQGELGFYAPGQPVQFCPTDGAPAPATAQGWMVVFHPDLLARRPAGPFPGSYPFFAYRVQQALALSATEEQLLNYTVQGLRQESEQPIDAFSQELLSTQLDVLLQYASRAYHRQFPVQPANGPDLLSRFEALLATYLDGAAEQPLPTVQHFADALHVSPAHLGDVLRTHTGQNAQQHLHAALLEKAKHLLLGTSWSIREIAFSLGFENPSYFSRLFKQKMGLTPAEFRQSAYLGIPAVDVEKYD
ncbi:helix-turn-helix domain-containing protein [Hymenobacter sp. GOD-10R]|uniref:helix-turn-helix domain-containing protein n=1 Tax=Hymenobacter sp. GOD-10R TaxID=3093922 RepID=UPI002D79047A|nr:helix-turn-helix domain-containing protein [Hymenobacter sp. GOD-10R]WRQ28602.1 helix-turn-helix domain-containing protein [Hymenobacter sp. GOD-10R]